MLCVNACGGTVVPLPFDASPDQEEPIVEDVPLTMVDSGLSDRTDDGAVPVVDTFVPTSDGAGLVQPSNRLLVKLGPFPGDDTPALTLWGAFPGPYIEDGQHGSERIQDGCYVRRFRNLQLRNVGVLRLRTPRLDRQNPARPDLYYDIGQRSYVDRAPEGLVISTTGSAALPEFSRSATLQPAVAMVTPPGGGRNLPRALVTTTMFRWRPTAASEVLLQLTGSGLTIQCRVAGSRGEFQFPPFATEEIQGIANLTAEVGSSDEQAVTVANTRVVVTTLNIGSVYYYADP